MISSRPAWRNSSPIMVNQAIKSIISGEKELKNPELVLELLIHIQGKLDKAGYTKVKSINYNY